MDAPQQLQNPEMAIFLYNLQIIKNIARIAQAVFKRPPEFSSKKLKNKKARLNQSPDGP